MQNAKNRLTPRLPSSATPTSPRKVRFQSEAPRKLLGFYLLTVCALEPCPIAHTCARVPAMLGVLLYEQIMCACSRQLAI